MSKPNPKSIKIIIKHDKLEFVLGLSGWNNNWKQINVIHYIINQII